jgi:hypothetical protein
MFKNRDSSNSTKKQQVSLRTKQDPNTVSTVCPLLIDSMEQGRVLGNLTVAQVLKKFLAFIGSKCYLQRS